MHLSTQLSWEDVSSSPNQAPLPSAIPGKKLDISTLKRTSHLRPERRHAAEVKELPESKNEMLQLKEILTDLRNSFSDEPEVMGSLKQVGDLTPELQEHVVAKTESPKRVKTQPDLKLSPVSLMGPSAEHLKYQNVPSSLDDLELPEGLS